MIISFLFGCKWSILVAYTWDAIFRTHRRQGSHDWPRLGMRCSSVPQLMWQQHSTRFPSKVNQQNFTMATVREKKNAAQIQMAVTLNKCSTWQKYGTNSWESRQKSWIFLILNNSLVWIHLRINQSRLSDMDNSWTISSASEASSNQFLTMNMRVFLLLKFGY